MFLSCIKQKIIKIISTLAGYTLASLVVTFMFLQQELFQNFQRKDVRIGKVQDESG